MRRGDQDDVDAVTHLLTDSVTDSPIAAWLVPDSVERRAVIAGYLRIWVGHALAHGHIDLIDEAELDPFGAPCRRKGSSTPAATIAVAVWFDQTNRPCPMPDSYDARLATACGGASNRFRDLDTALDAQHPHELAHHHLALLAVHPEHRGHGLGNQLLTAPHTARRHAGHAAFTHAVTGRSAAFLTHHGYLRLREPQPLPDNGPRLWPLWRPSTATLKQTEPTQMSHRTVATNRSTGDWQR